MDKVKAKQYLSFLEEKFEQWYLSPEKDRPTIEAEVYNAAMQWDDEIYLYLMGIDDATGLFKHGFFDSDIKRSIGMLRDIVNEGNPKPENKIYKIYTILQNYKAPQGEVVKKELKDYLLDKISNGDLKDGKITFRDADDFEYFSKLTSAIGMDSNALLEEIVLDAFKNG